MSGDDIWRTVPAYIGAFTALGGTIYAFFTANRWRREMLGKHEFEAARNVMAKVLRVELEMRDARRTFYRDRYPKVWEKVEAAQRELELSLIDARTLWGARRLEQPAEALIEEINSLHRAFLTMEVEFDNPGQQSDEQPDGEAVTNAIHMIVGYETEEGIVVVSKSEEGVSKAVGSFEATLKQYFPSDVRWSERFQKWLDKIEPIKEWQTDRERAEK